MRPRRFAFGIALLLSGTAHPVQAETVYDGLVGNDQGELSSFAELVRQAFGDDDLRRILDGDGSFTVFAPTNEALAELFDALSEEELAQLQDPNSGALERLLRYHITQGAWRQPTGALRMLDDNVAQTYRDGHALRIDQASIIEQTRYSNGIVAAIDRVISPPDAPLPVGCGITSSHANDLFFDTFSSVSGVFGAHFVTNCQPYGKVLFQGSKLIINAGRKNSSGPAQFFMNGLEQTNVLPTGTKEDFTPSELHFVQVLTTLTASVGGETFVCDNVRFGQGDSGDANNWWVGQAGAVWGSDDTSWYLDLDCTVADQSSCRLRFRATGLSDHFDVSAVDCE